MPCRNLCLSDFWPMPAGTEFDVGPSRNTDHPRGKLLFQLLAVMAEFERDLIQERVILANRRRGR